MRPMRLTKQEFLKRLGKLNGRQLRNRRARLGLSQVRLGEALGVSGNTVARWERDEMAPPGYLLELALRSLERESDAHV